MGRAAPLFLSLIFFCQLSCHKLPLISPGLIQRVLGGLINKGRGRRGLYPGRLIAGLKTAFQNKLYTS